MGEIVERKYDDSQQLMEVEEIPSTSSNDTGFPKSKPIDVRAFAPGTKEKSLFSQMFSSKSSAGSSTKVPSGKGTLLDKDKQDIHQQNLDTIKQMSETEILEEREKLLKSLDPKVVEFLRSKKSQSSQIQEKEETKMEVEHPKTEGNHPNLNFLNDEDSKNWLHFDIFEPEKLEWTKDIEATFANLKEGEIFEARFDWKGFLLPYIERDTEKDDRELYCHGEDPHRPGYTLQELFRLARSDVLQQRVSALNAIAGILNIYNQGYYDDILEFPISKIFFFLRFALDENTPAIVEAASKALSYLFYNDTDETLLDIACETYNGIYQPSFENLGKSEINDELETSLDSLKIDGKKSKLFETNLSDLTDGLEGDKDNLNDFHLAEVDLVECLVRTNIIERISYILTVMEPNDATILSCTKILIRVARSSQENALKILNKSNLIGTIRKKHLPDIENGELINNLIE